MERSRLENRLAQWGALAGSLAHEIRNPLSTINLTLHLLKEDLVRPRAGSTPPVGRIDLLITEVEHLQRILNDFLRLARQPDLSLEPVDLNSLVEETMAFLQPELGRLGVTLVSSVDRRVPFVQGDATLLRQVLLNLFRNALESMPRGGTLTVQTEGDERILRLRVIDTGVGIDAETLDRIFDVFFSTKPGGTGIGLPLIRQFVELHGGSVAVQSEPGRGSLFTVHLPINGPAGLGGDAA